MDNINGNQPKFSPPVVDAEVVETKLNFPAAMAEIIKGNKVARKEWQNTDYGLLKEGWLSIYRNGEFFTWKVNDGDMLAEDWFVVGKVN